MRRPSVLSFNPHEIYNNAVWPFAIRVNHSLSWQCSRSMSNTWLRKNVALGGSDTNEVLNGELMKEERVELNYQ